MASEEQRISDLEEKAKQQEAASITLLDIVKGIDHNVTELTGSVRSVVLQQAMIDVRMGATETRLGAVDLRLNMLDTRVGALAQDMANSFRQVEATMASKQDLAYLATKVDTLAEEMHGKLDQVIDLLTRKPEE